MEDLAPTSQARQGAHKSLPRRSFQVGIIPRRRHGIQIGGVNQNCRFRESGEAFVRAHIESCLLPLLAPGATPGAENVEKNAQV